VRLILIRHGQTPSNLLKLLDTAEPGPGLTAHGAAQAAAVPAALAGQPIDAIFASTLVRSQLTAAVLATQRGLEVQVRTGIREVPAGRWEMRSDKVAVDSYMSTVFAWAKGDLDLPMAGAERGREVLAAFDEVVAEAAGHGAAVLVSHGAAIRMWAAARVTNLSAAFVEASRLVNTAIVTVDGNPDNGWIARSWAGVPLDGSAPAPGAPTGKPI
jgi:broad specificity phosphatase PhoE